MYVLLSVNLLPIQQISVPKPAYLKIPDWNCSFLSIQRLLVQPDWSKSRLWKICSTSMDFKDILLPTQKRAF